MSTTITLKYVNPAAEGKKFGSVVDLGDTKYLVAAGLVGRFVKGGSYEVSLEQQDWNGKSVTLIKGIESVRTAHAPERAAEVAQKAANRPLEASTGGRLTEPELRFVSNVVGSAITAKTLTDPLEVSVWAKAAAAAVKEL